MKTLTANFDRAEYSAIRLASMRGKLDASFTRGSNGDVAFRVRNARRFFDQIETIVDFGGVSASEVFFIKD